LTRRLLSAQAIVKMNEQPSLQPLLDKLKRTGKVDENLIPDHLLEAYFETMEHLRSAYGDDGRDLSDDELENLRLVTVSNLGLRPGGELQMLALHPEPTSEPEPVVAAPMESRRPRRSVRPRERRERRRSARSSSRGGDSGDPDLADEPKPPPGRGAA
jgi:hypothetical protein